MRVAVLGAPTGRGRRVLRDLLECPDVASILLVGPAERDLARLIGAFDPRRMDAAVVPPTVDGIAEALKGADIAVSCLEDPLQRQWPNPTQPSGEVELMALRAAQRTGVPYVSACEDADTVEAMLGMHGDADGSAPIAVAGMSWSPGVSNLLARAAAARFEAVESIRICWFVSVRDEASGAVERVLAAWSGDAEVIEGGQRGLRPAATRPQPCFFPEPMGWQRVRLARAAEVLSLPDLVGDLESLEVLGGTDAGSATSLARAAARGSTMVGGTLGRGLGILSRSAIAGLAPGSARRDGWSGLRVDATGRRDGVRAVETYGVLDRLGNLESVPLVVACLLVAGGEATGRGVVAPEAAFEPARFLELLAERGVRAARLLR